MIEEYQYIKRMKVAHVKKEVNIVTQAQTCVRQAFIHYIEARHGIIRKTVEKTEERGDNVSCFSS